MESKGSTKKVHITIMLAIALFFVLMISIFLVSCSTGNIKITYTKVNGEQQELTVKKGTKIGEIGEAEAVDGYTFEGWYKDSTLHARYSDDDVLESDTTLYPNYVAKKYQVIFYSNNGNDENYVETHYFNSKFKLPNCSFTLTNYDFVGWSKNKDDVAGSSTIENAGKEIQLTTEGAVYYAIWESKDFDIEYDFSDALLDSQAINAEELVKTIKIGSSLTLPTFTGTITKVGDTLGDFIFAGFIINETSYAAGQKVSITGDMIINSKIKIIVEWSRPNEGMVSFSLNKPTNDQKDILKPDNIVLSERDENGNFVFNLPVCENLYGHTFTGWRISGTSTVIPRGSAYTTKNVLTTLEAVWEVQSRIINFSNGTNIVKSLYANYGGTLDLGINPNIISIDELHDFANADKWSFVGWKKELPTEEATTNYAGEITVLFKAEECSYQNGMYSIILYANYARRQVNLEFIANGGDGAIEDVLVNTCENFEVSQAMQNEISRQYYTLVGFSTDSESTVGSNPINVGTEDLTLYAVWERNKITITYDDENGAIIPASLQIDEGSNLTLTKTGFSYAGHELTGFKISGDVLDTIYNVSQSVFLETDTTFIPEWAELDNINFRGAGYQTDTVVIVTKTDGTMVETSNLEVGDEIVLPTYASAADSYVDENGTRLYFAGWSLTEGLAVPTHFANTIYTVTNNFDVFYPVYMPETAGLSFITNNTNNTASVAYNGEELSEGNILIYPNVYIENDTEYIVKTIANQTSDGMQPAEVEHVIISEGITTIGNYAFNGCADLTDVLIPKSATTIRQYAFYDCSLLSILTIPENMKTFGTRVFGNCTGLTQINFYATNMNNLSGSTTNAFYNAGTSGNGIVFTTSDNVTKIPDYLFYPESGSRVKIKTIRIGAGVTNTGWLALMSNGALEEIFVDPNNTSYTSRNLNGEEVNALINMTAKTVALGCKNSVIPDDGSVTQIGNYAFNGCRSLTSLTIPETITTIGEYAFSAGVGLLSLVIPDSVVTIKHNAFTNCGWMTSLTIGTGVKQIGSSAFLYCNSLTNIYYNATNANNLTSTSAVFSYSAHDSAGITVVIGDNVERIPNYLFYVERENYQPKITNVVIGSGVTEIGAHSFQLCNKITSIFIPENVTTIGDEAFEGCTGLNTVSIDSEDIAGTFIDSTSNGSLIANAEIVYIKDGLDTSLSTYLQNNFSIDTSDVSGYVKWVKNA